VNTARRRPGASDRWLLAGAAFLVQLALGAVYAWSVFVKPLRDQMGWSRTEATLPFIVTIGVLFVGTFVGGRLQDRVGPRPVALAGGTIYAAGVMLASLVETPDQLWLLVLTYGLIAGIGLGAGYIVPIAMLVKWFPDRRGLITGIAVGGFGAGALITAPVAGWLIDRSDVAQVFLPLGTAYLVATIVGASFFRNPPASYAVAGFEPAAPGMVSATDSYSLAEALCTPQWYRMTAILALNVTAGIALISHASPAAQDLANVSKATADGVVGILAIFNGVGRILWGWTSDSIGRMRAFLMMFAIQGVCFALLPLASSIRVFFLLGALVYLCYGGGFGTMPAAAADFFGPRNAGAIYGTIIVGWSIGGVLGPVAIAAIADATDGYTVAFFIIAGMVLASTALPLTTKTVRRRTELDEGRRGAVSGVPGLVVSAHGRASRS
jgi:OFA family oxalate/formate antiporter-like MFS transporter